MRSTYRLPSIAGQDRAGGRDKGQEQGQALGLLVSNPCASLDPNKLPDWAATANLCAGLLDMGLICPLHIVGFRRAYTDSVRSLEYFGFFFFFLFQEKCLFFYHLFVRFFTLFQENVPVTQE